MLVLVVLGALWAVVLVPPLLRSRTERTSDSIGDFNYRLGVLGRTNGALPAPRAAGRPVSVRRSPLPPTFGKPPMSAAKRRRDVLTVLVGAVFITALLASMSGVGVLWAAQMLADVCLVAYLALWAWLRSLQADRAETVRMLPQRRAPELALRRTGSS